MKTKTKINSFNRSLEKQNGNKHINKCTTFNVQLWLRKLKLIKLIWGKCNWNGKLAQCNGLGARRLGAQGLVHFSCINNNNVCMIPLNSGYGIS